MREEALSDLNSLLEVLKIKDLQESWFETWEDSVSTFPGDGLWFLQEKYLLEANKTFGLRDEVISALLQTAELIRSDTNLCILAWHYYRIIFCSQPIEYPMAFRFPSLKDYMGEHSARFDTLILFSGLKEVLKLHREKGIPQSVTIHTRGP